MQFQAFETLTFDIVGTLIDYRSGVLQWLRARLARDGIEPPGEQILAAFHAAEENEHAARPQTPFTQTLPEIWRHVADNFSAGPNPDDGRDFIASMAYWPPFEDSVAALERLARRYRLLAITNADRWAAVRMAAILDNPFELIVTAEDVGVTKPDPRPFRRALAELSRWGTEAARMLHVAQGQASDVTPARNLGVPVVWVNRTGESRRETKPDLEVNSLAELVKHIEAPSA